MPTTTAPAIKTITELLKHLIRMPTVTTDTATNRAAIDWVEEQLKDLPLHIKRFESNGVPSLIATTRDTKNPKLWLQAHMDVVPGPVAVFEPHVKDGRLIGRGAYDMKFAIALYIRLLQELGSSLPQYDLGLMLTADEEVSGKNGVGYLTGLGYIGETVLLPDSGPNWGLEVGAKGAFFWKFTAKGSPAHGSRVWQGTNAIDRLNRFLAELKANTGMPVEPCSDDQHLHNSFNIGYFNGGVVVNQIAAEAEAHVDLRVVPGTTAEEMQNWIEQAQIAVPGVKAERLPMFVEPYTIPLNGGAAVFRRIAEATIGRPLFETVAHGGSDARWFAAHGVPVIVCCPNSGDHHTAAEWIDLEDLGRFYEVTRHFVDEWAKA